MLLKVICIVMVVAFLLFYIFYYASTEVYKKTAKGYSKDELKKMLAKLEHEDIESYSLFRAWKIDVFMEEFLEH
ncbi:MAG: hypothetical protein IKW58_02625 [Alphaproteobacteria bacterium]|nr:hypothetical protein [Alphaproteobacteria bacterium]